MKTLSDTLIARLDDPLRSSNIPWKKKLLVRQREWVSKTDHSQGFNLLNEIDITNYTPRGKIAEITEEIENDIDPNEANYGVIKASQFNQELSEETVGTEDMTKGELLKTIHAETGSSFSSFYKYSGSDIHLWELVLQVGDIDNDDYVEYSWILGWLFDPDNELQPRWIGSSRNVSKFTLTACSLLYWLKDVGTSFLGDMVNPSGRHTDGSELVELSRAYKICNYPLPQIIKKILYEAGVVDSAITTMTFPVDSGTNPLFSTLEYLDKANSDTPSASNGEVAPQAFHWKVSGGFGYHVWIPSWGGTDQNPYLYVTICDADGSHIYDIEPIDLKAINSNVPTGWIRRFWYDASNTFYALLQTSSSYQMLKIVLGGTVGEIADNTTITISGTCDPTGNYEFHWGQCDLDFGSDRLYAAWSDNVAAYDYSIGYWALSYSATGSGSSSWTARYTLSSDNYSYKLVHGYWADHYITGFRCVKHASGRRGICAFAADVTGTNDRLKVVAWDDTNGNGYIFDYDDVGAPVFNIHWKGLLFVDGRGTIGGFSDTISGTDYFEFPLTSQFYRKGYWCKWEVNTDPSGGELLEVGTHNDGEYRTFNSHGSLDLPYCNGWIAANREVTSVGADHEVLLYPTIFNIESDTENLDALGVMADFGDYYEWPIVSPLSFTADTEWGASAKTTHTTASARPFVVFRTFTPSQGGTSDHAFLIVASQSYFPNFSFDFYTENPSIADCFKDIATCYGLIMKIGHDSTIIRPRNDTGPVDKVLTRDHYRFLGQADEVVKGYEGVEITCYQTGSSNPYTAGYVDGGNVLSVETDFLVPNRASDRATALWAAWKYNQVVYKFEARCLPYAEPGDKVTIPKIVPPGDDHEDFTGVIMRSSLKELNSPIEVKTIDTTGAAVL